jgi:hypothetical protein
MTSMPDTEQDTDVRIRIPPLIYGTDAQRPYSGQGTERHAGYTRDDLECRGGHGH